MASRKHPLKIVHPGHHAAAEVHPDAAVLAPRAEVAPKGLEDLSRHGAQQVSSKSGDVLRMPLCEDI